MAKYCVHLDDQEYEIEVEGDEGDAIRAAREKHSVEYAKHQSAHRLPDDHVMAVPVVIVPEPDPVVPHVDPVVDHVVDHVKPVEAPVPPVETHNRNKRRG